MTHEAASHGQANRLALLGIFAVLALYVVAAVLGLPQRATALIVAAASHGDETPQDDPLPHEGEAEPGHEAEAEHGHEAEAEHAAEHAPPVPPPYWTVTPFILLLAAIAVLPLIPFTQHWWESNLHRFYVAAGLGLLTLLYYALLHPAPVEGHWPAHYVAERVSDGVQWNLAWTVLANAILSEYIPFIVLLFSLYTISGGIRISGDLPAHSLTNTTFIGVGALLASLVGTTGAAMLLIRPLLETNSERRYVKHTVVIFIFAVCNCGGCLLPIGDPPLFLGYLRGVPFL